MFKNVLMIIGVIGILSGLLLFVVDIDGDGLNNLQELTLKTNPFNSNPVISYALNKIAIGTVDRLKILENDGRLDTNDKKFIDFLAWSSEIFQEAILNSSILDDGEISDREFNFIKQLEQYPDKLKVAFIKNINFSGDYEIQITERTILDHAKIIFEDYEIRNACGVNDWNYSITGAFLEILYFYETNLSKDLSKEQVNELNEMLYQFNPYDGYGDNKWWFVSNDEIKKEIEFANLFREINPFIGKYETLSEIFKRFGVNDPQVQGFLQNLAHMIWLEENHLVPWSIKEYTVYEIKSLVGDIKWDRPRSYKSPIDRLCYDISCGYFPAEMLIKESKDQLEAAKKIIDWARWHFMHIVLYSGEKRGDEWKRVYGRLYPEDPRRPPLWITLIKKQGGCHIAAKTVVGLLRAINIPAEVVGTHELYTYKGEWSGMKGHGFSAGHAVIHLVSLDLYMHGDNIYGGHRRHENTSVEDWLWTKQKIVGYLNGANRAAEFFEKRAKEEGIDIFVSGYGFYSIVEVENGWKYIFYWYMDGLKHYVIIYTTIDGTITNTEEFNASDYEQNK